MRLLIAVMFVVAACGDGLPTAAPQDPEVLLTARTTGVTLKPGDAGLADLAGGPYRIAWVAESCSFFQVAWVRDDGGTTPIETVGASGELYIELPAGHGSLDRAADCEYTIRFEQAP